MPLRSKRKGDWDPNKSDSEDETYGTSASKALKSRSSVKQPGRPSRKRQRTGHNADESDEDDVIEESEFSGRYSDEDDIEDDEVEIGPNGRPKRKAAKKQTTYEESDSEESEDHLGDKNPPQMSPEKPSLVVTLNVRTPTQTSGPRRSIRARSGSITTSRPVSSHQPQSNTRRSSRIAHDDTEPVVALTNSGHHVDILRPGTRSPQEVARPTRGGKGLKKLPSASIVYEESEQSSARPHEEPHEEPLEYRPEIAASHDDLRDVNENRRRLDSDDEGVQQSHAKAEAEADRDVAIVPESGEDDDHGDEEEEDPISKPGRNLRRRNTQPAEADRRAGGRSTRQALRSTLGKRKTRSSQRSVHQESSDFEPGIDEVGDEDVSDSDASSGSPHKGTGPRDGNDSSPGRRGAKRRKPNPHSRRSSDSSEEAEELAEELQDLTSGRRSRRAPKNSIIFEARPRPTRQQKHQPDYRIMKPDALGVLEDDPEPAASTTPSRRGRTGAGWQRSLFSTYGPFGGAGGPTPLFGGPGGIGAAAGADSDSSDDEIMQHPRATAVGGTLGMTPTTAHPPGMNLFPPPTGQLHGQDPLQGPAGTPANLGKIKDKSALADADPLGVDQNVTFDGVGGLQGHIDQLKEMVALPLLYPEIFQRFRVTPPRGVLFHGPPGTGKTLLARALASSVSSHGRKVTFYMRKGADALSKWVGEAERQLRLLFDEARKNQPSIIFFDEIDGLAPVRSSKQEQIHASIVSTLLALMDGMDGRGQVIVIGATNRPDSVDPALRRPGRFDREFYFPLPNKEARRTILNIHTKLWDPPLDDEFKDSIADLTKGYGGADLRALCTEAALNAVQRQYPQIYRSNEKLQIDPTSINITAKDFMISVKKMIPSSERSASSGAAPLPERIQPLLQRPLDEIKALVNQIIPQKKRLTALEEAEFEDAEVDKGLEVERLQQEFERSRIFRPRLLIKGPPGSGQQYLTGALFNHFEGLHVQAFDLPTLMSDSTRSPEAAIVQLFTEVRRHKPSVIYIPNVDAWYQALGQVVISTFVGLLRSLPPTDPILVLGVLENNPHDNETQMLKELFGFSRHNRFEIPRPDRQERLQFFVPIIDLVNVSPMNFPEAVERKKRQLPMLTVAPPEPMREPPPPTKAQLKAQKKKDRYNLNLLKQNIQPVMDQIRTKSKKFRFGVIDEAQIKYLYDEEDPDIITTDLPPEERDPSSRPYEKAKDDHGDPGLLQVATGKFYYNMNTVVIEQRLSNGYYKRPKDFLADVKKLAKDAKVIDDQERLIKANELMTNVEVDMENFAAQQPALVAELENIYVRELKRERDMIEKAKQLAAEEGRRIDIVPSNVPPSANIGASSTEQSSGPIVLGQPITNGLMNHPITPSNASNSHPSTLTNGVSAGLSDLSDLHGQHQSNGTSVPSRSDGEVHLSNSDLNASLEKGGTQSSSFGQSAQSRPYESAGAPYSIGRRKSVPDSHPGSLSQRGFITPIAEGSDLKDYANYASTTSSEKRNTGSSGDKNTQQNITQSTTGKPEGPDLTVFGEPAEGHSQLPDTVGNTQGMYLFLKLAETVVKS